jgi:hypothetical protein
MECKAILLLQKSFLPEVVCQNLQTQSSGIHRLYRFLNKHKEESSPFGPQRLEGAQNIHQTDFNNYGGT